MPQLAQSLHRLSLPALLLCAGCEPHHRAPPGRLIYAGLPVTGSLADAKRLGFTDCFNYTAIELRCQRHGVTLAGQGPYQAAVDLVGSDGSGGFDQVTLWHDTDQEAVYKITDALEKQGWRSCYNTTGADEHGDQMIFTREGVAVRISMDMSYWGKRRLRVLPPWNKERGCVPKPTPVSAAAPSPSPTSPGANR